MFMFFFSGGVIDIVCGPPLAECIIGNFASGAAGISEGNPLKSVIINETKPNSSVLYFSSFVIVTLLRKSARFIFHELTVFFLKIV